MIALRSFLFAVLAILTLGFGVAPGFAPAQVIGPQLPDTVVDGVPDYSTWSRVAVRAERALESGSASSFALERLRAELSTWRDQFLDAESLNGGRINTVTNQIATLGEPPAEGESEPVSIATRRAELKTTLARLQAPVILAQEAYARANGLIGEIDSVLRMREAERLSTRGDSPMSPSNWAVARAALGQGIGSVWNESTTRFRTNLRSGKLWLNLATSALLLGIALILIAKGRAWTRAAQSFVDRRIHKGNAVWRFLLSIGNVVIPLLGIVFFEAALNVSGLLGYRGKLIASALPDAALYVIVALWLAGHHFPYNDQFSGPLDIKVDVRGKARRLVAGLGWVLAFGAMLLSFLSAGDAAGLAGSVLLFPVEIIAAVYLFGFGRLIWRECSPDDASLAYRNRIISIVGQAAMLVAVVAPVLALFGYSEAAQGLLYPAVTTLGVLGLILLLQRLVVDIYVLLTGAPEKASEALVPVLIGFALLFLALPMLALTWGAREADLWELWTRFREGFTIGDTRISPADFLTFVLVFGVGYTVTRFVQGTLKSTVLPKTRMDVGGQNAVVSGLGYVGIFLAALIAITTAGIDLSNLAIVAGALSVGVGFGLQTIVSNFVSGIILLIERPISEGDWIEVGGQMGYVRDISVRATRIETFDRRDVIIPNADLVSGQVTNWTRGNLVGRIIVNVGVAYGTDTHRIETILQEIVEEHPMVLLSPPPAVLFTGFGADSLDFEIRAVLRDVNFSLVTKSDLHHKIAARFAEEGIEIPFAQRDLWLRNPEALRTAKEEGTE